MLKLNITIVFIMDLSLCLYNCALFDLSPSLFPWQKLSCTVFWNQFPKRECLGILLEEGDQEKRTVATDCNVNLHWSLQHEWISCGSDLGCGNLRLQRRNLLSKEKTLALFIALFKHPFCFLKLFNSTVILFKFSIW